ncbi:MAG: hypothetical protein AAGG54_12040, partial [Pseudomonadota bacterium]
VPVAVVLLDACRINPFPTDFRVAFAGQAEPLPVSQMGLTPPNTRGAFSVDAPAEENAENLATLVGFAAEPGKAALDGTPGGNSPYAAAILRHLGAADGASFSTVMSLIGEEVYLKTDGFQRHWVSQSLRRQLYFGGKAPAADPDQALVTDERRSLLVHIAQFSLDQRAPVKQLAAARNIPMDVVFAVLRAANVPPDASSDALEEIVASHLMNFSVALNGPTLIANPDAELLRLTRLADDAELQGAFNAANRFRDLAKERVQVLEQSLDDQLETLIDRKREHAAAFANSAKTKALQGDFLAAAADYEAAFDKIKRWDTDLAFDYRRFQFVELMSAHSVLSLDAAILEQLITAALLEIEAPTVLWSPEQSARFHKFLGQASAKLYEASGEEADFAFAKLHYEASIRLNDHTNLREAGMVRHDLSGLFFEQYNQINAIASLETARDLVSAARSIIDPDGELESLIRLYNEALQTKGSEHADAKAILSEIYEVLSRPGGNQRFSDLSLIIASDTIFLANLGEYSGSPQFEDMAIEEYDFAIKLHKAGGNNARVADTHANRGNLFMRRARRGLEGNAQRAYQDYVAALNAIGPDTHPVSYASTYDTLLSLVLDYSDTFSSEQLQEVVDLGTAWRSDSANLGLEARFSSFENSMARLYIQKGRETREVEPLFKALDWLDKFAALSEPGSSDAAVAAFNRGLALYEIAEIENRPPQFQKAAESFVRAAEIHDTLGNSADAFSAWYENSNALAMLAYANHEAADYQTAVVAYKRALAATHAEVSSDDLAYLHYDLGLALDNLGQLNASTEQLELAAQEYMRAASFFEQAGMVDEALEVAYQAAGVTHNLSYFTSDMALLEEAIRGYHAVLNAPGELSREFQFHLQLDMGSLLRHSAFSTGDNDTILRAKARVEKALELATLTGLDAEEALPDRVEKELMARAELGEILFALGDREPRDAALLRRAADELETVGFAKTGDASRRMQALNTAAYALVLAHQASAQSETLISAVEMAEAAIKIAIEINDNAALPYIEGTLCEALIERALVEQDRSFGERALPFCRQSLTALQSAGDARALAIAETSMRRVQDLLQTQP